MARNKALIIVLLLSVVGTGYAQTPQECYEAFKKQARQQYNDFRTNANKQYAEFVKQSWRKFRALEPIPHPIEKNIPPVVCPEEERQKERKNERQVFSDVISAPQPKPQPEPVSPIPPSPEPISRQQDTIVFSYYGMDMACVVETLPRLTLKSLEEEDIAEGWGILSSGPYDALLGQCLAIRRQYRLNDWGYLRLLSQIGENAIGQKGNESTLLTAWLYCQSGYKMRLARSEDGNLYMLFACEGVIYDQYYYAFGDEKYYPYGICEEDELEICEASFPKEQSMSLLIAETPRFPTQNPIRKELTYPEMSVTTEINPSLLSFYGDYPSGALTDFMGSRWAMYAMTPISEEVRQSLYPQLKQKIIGKGQVDATNELLTFVQKAFVYAYDDSIWGADRAFFAEETLFYPYSDCEDRSILFSKLVKDLVGLDIVLLYFPNHVATAVKFTEEPPNGDYLELSDGRYLIADPTYTGATVGMTMPLFQNEKAIVITLK
ncbi:MAG: hypothetical protein J6X88_03610 [Bacteroidales bacterium]|nr:hypothetical protein [Bacteroidales bacterium]